MTCSALDPAHGTKVYAVVLSYLRRWSAVHLDSKHLFIGKLRIAISLPNGMGAMPHGIKGILGCGSIIEVLWNIVQRVSVAMANHLSATVCDHEATDTGLVDLNGDAIMRAPRPIGFGRDDEW